MGLSLFFLLTVSAAAQTVVSFPTADGGVVDGDLYGAGGRGVVLVHGGRFDKASWKPQALELERLGMRVLSINLRGKGASRGPGMEDMFTAPFGNDVIAAVRYLRQIGAVSVSLVGGSIGGSAAAAAVPMARPGEIDGLVLLGAEPDTAAEKLAVRKLYIVAKDDASGSGPRLPGIQAHFAKASQPKRLVVVDGSAHAQFLFQSDQAARVMKEIVAFVQPSREWISLFDGKTFAGWDKRNELWAIEDGTITSVPGGARRGDLMTVEKFRDFEMEFEWKVAKGANAGVKYRLQGTLDFLPGARGARTAGETVITLDIPPDKPVSVLGFEYQIIDDVDGADTRRGDKWAAGALYEFVGAKKTKPAAGEVWHRGRIVLRGMHTEHWLDGEKVMEAELDTPGLIWSKTGSFRAATTGPLMMHRHMETPIALQFHSSKVWYRNLRVRRIN